MPTPLDELWFRLLAGLLLGLCLGSFATMLSYRLPRGLPITLPPSRCPVCGTRLGVKDLFPVFSWLFSKGHCRHCGTKIPLRYPLIELATGGLTVLTFGLLKSPLLLLPALILITALVTAATIRLERNKKPKP